MARSLVLQEIQIGSIIYPSAKSAGLMSNRIHGLTQTTMTYNGTLINCTQIKYLVGDGSAPQLRIVTQAASDIRTSINTANTSNNVDVVSITQKNTDGTTTARTVNVADIVAFYAHPDSTFDSLLQIEDLVQTTWPAIKADESVQSIQSSLNA